MTALSAARNIKRRAVTRINRPVSSGKTVYAGGLATLLTADGTAVAAGTASAGAAIGVFRDTVVGDGTLTVDIEPGCFLFDNSTTTDEIAAADIGATCYIADDSTVAKTDATGTRKVAGTVADIDDNGVWVIVGNPVN